MSARSQTRVYPHHRFTVDDYLMLAEQGLFGRDGRVELMDGEIFDMPPMGPEHANLLARLNRLLVTRCGPLYEVRPQLPVVLGDSDAPEPDLCVIRQSRRHVRSPHPEAGSVVLVVEISKSSKAYDMDIQLPRYALHGIPEAWIVDVAAQRIEVYTQPEGDRYRSRRVLGGTDTLAPGRVEGVIVEVDELFSD